jgi:hypothetical protein
MGRPITATGAQFAHFRGERLKQETRWRERRIRTPETLFARGGEIFRQNGDLFWRIYAEGLCGEFFR